MLFWSETCEAGERENEVEVKVKPGQVIQLIRGLQLSLQELSCCFFSGAGFSQLPPKQ
jgi:hypothetical protein